MKNLKMFLVIGVLFLSMNSVSSQERGTPDVTLEFIGPAGNELQDSVNNCGVFFGFSYVTDQSGGGLRKGRVDDISINQIKVTTFKGGAAGTMGKGLQQVFHREVARSDTQCSLRLKAAGAPESYKVGKIMNWWDEPSFSPTDVLLDSYKFNYSFSVATDYPAEAVLANFDRIADKECYNSSYSRGVAFDFQNSVRDPVYCIQVGTKVQPVRIGCAPYRKGSKCTAFAVLQSVRDGEKFSALEGATLLREKIKAIVND